MTTSAPPRFVTRVVEQYDDKIRSDDVARRFGFSGGPDGEVRCVGSAGRTADAPDLTAYTAVSARSRLAFAPVAGPLSTVTETLAAKWSDWYLVAIGEHRRCTGNG